MDMIQKVGAAIFDALEAHGEWDGLALQSGKFYVDGSIERDVLVRACIEAMREPTQLMLSEAVRDAEDEYHFGPHEARHVWRTMVEAALTSPA